MNIVRSDGMKVIIEGAPKVTWATGQMCEFAAALVSALACLGERVPYDYVMGVSGAAFRLTLFPEQWNPGNYSIRSIASDPLEPIRRAFRAIGYRHTVYERSDEDSDVVLMMDSIERGVPVLAFGVVGPSDVSIITGFDERGRVLLGWSTYQDIPDDHNVPHDPSGYFRKPDWHANTAGFVRIGQRTERPPLRDTYIETLEWVVDLACTPQAPDRHTGLAAYSAWADEMEQPRFFPADDPETLGARYLSFLCNLMMIVDRRSAVGFLRMVGRDEPDMAPHALAAARCYDRTVSLKDDMDALVPEDFASESIARLADPKVRRECARVIRRMRDSDAEAIRHIERALSRRNAFAPLGE